MVEMTTFVENGDIMTFPQKKKNGADLCTKAVHWGSVLLASLSKKEKKKGEKFQV